MRVLHYLEFEGPLERSGIATATAHQRAALSTDGCDGIELVTNPWRESVSRAVRLTARGTPTRPHLAYDVAHCNGIGPGTVAIGAHARRTGRPLVLHAHVTREDFRESFRGSNELAAPLGRYLRWLYGQADLVCCPSEQTKRHLEAYPVTAPIEPISNGVDLDALAGYEQFREPCRERYDLEGPVVFAVGNVFERKGLSTFCRLARTLPYEFVWFGPYDRGPHASAAVRYWTQNPPPNVTFTGWIEDKRSAFAAGDIFCFPTHAENQGIAVLEAMACERAVVLRDLPVFEEFYTDGVDCLKCETEDEFRRALETLAVDPAFRRQLGRRARETAAAHGLERVGERLREIYARLCT